MLQNRLTDEQLLQIGKFKAKEKFTAPKEPREQAEAKAYLTQDDKKPYVPAESLMACLIEAGKFIRLDKKRQMSTAKGTLLPGFLSVEEFYLPLIDPKTNKSAAWEVDMRAGRNPNGGEAVCIVRPRYDSWSFTFTALLDTEQLDEKVYRNLVDIAGSNMGLGDFRPQRKGIYGRFKVTSWKRLESYSSAAQ